MSTNAACKRSLQLFFFLCGLVRKLSARLTYSCNPTPHVCTDLGYLLDIIRLNERITYSPVSEEGTEHASEQRFSKHTAP